MNHNLNPKFTEAGRPQFSTEEVVKHLQRYYGMEGLLDILPAEWDQNFRLDAGDRGMFVVKIGHLARRKGDLDFQNAAMERLSTTWQSGRSPTVVKTNSGDMISSIDDKQDQRHLVRVLTYLQGQPLSSVGELDTQTLIDMGIALGDLDQCLSGFRHPSMVREFRWDLRQANWISSYTKHISDIQRRGIVERSLLQFQARIAPMLHNLPESVIHNDANDENILLRPGSDGGWAMSGLLDFGDMLWTNTVNELAVACAYALLRLSDPLAVIAWIAEGYHRARPLSELEIKSLFGLIWMRLCISVVSSTLAAEEDPKNAHRQITEHLAWLAMEQLEEIDWHDAERKIRAACGYSQRLDPKNRSAGQSRESLLEERRKWLGPSLSLSYEDPLEIVRGRGQFLFDQNEQAYLDCVNNVAHVGHSHPKVVAALARQAGMLNTNSRYLHPLRTEYAQRLAETFPEPLRVCFFVNSGSEANELAVRMARTHAGHRDVIVVDGGYHGNTQTLIDLSPYKAEGPGGKGLANWAHKVIKPDPYRGPYRGMGKDIGEAYAENVREVCDDLVEKERAPALFLCESILGCGGQIVLPEGYLTEVYRHVRAVGGVCIADEVQVGMGRVGDYMWAFESQGVVPDIVTLGKPIGNGHPLAAVVTTPEIANSFANGMEYFNTFGGNPVSMAVGLAVLDVIDEEQLRDRAKKVGDYLVQGFTTLAEKHPEIGDVRGLGLFLGVELVEDRKSLTPATEMTAQLIERVKTDGILLSVEGPYENVLKIKPPMQFTETEADLLLGAVDRGLSFVRENRKS